MTLKDVQGASLYEINKAVEAWSEMESRPVMSEDEFEERVVELQSLNLPWVKTDARYRR